MGSIWHLPNAYQTLYRFATELDWNSVFLSDLIPLQFCTFFAFTYFFGDDISIANFI
jgi:hypothetical protein